MTDTATSALAAPDDTLLPPVDEPASDTAGAGADTSADSTAAAGDDTLDEALVDVPAWVLGTLLNAAVVVHGSGATMARLGLIGGGVIDADTSEATVGVVGVSVDLESAMEIAQQALHEVLGEPTEDATPFAMTPDDAGAGP